MTAGDFNRLNGQMQRMRQSLQGVNRSTASAGRNSQMLGRDLSQLSARFTQMSRSGRLTRRELDGMNNTLVVMSRTARQAARSGEITRNNFRALRSEIGRMRAELRLIGGDGNVFQRLNDRLLLFQHRMRDTNNHAGTLRRSLNRMGDGAITGLRGALLGTLALTGAMKKLGSIININKRWTAVLLAVLLLIGPAASALGALLVTALGGAFIALGALALKNSATVKGAFASMKESVARDVREAAQPMEGQLAQGIRAVATAVSVMRPALEGAFRATGPLIDDFMGAFTDLAAMSLPGITQALEGLGPAMEGFRTAMGLVGKGLGDMFAAMTAGGGAEALKDIWITLGVELANLLVGIGEFINMANQSGTSTMLLIGFFRSLSGVLNIVEFALRSVDSVFGGLFQHLNRNITGLDKLTGGIDGIGASFVASGQSAESLKRQLADVNKEVERIQKVRKNLNKDLPGPYKDFVLDKEGASDKDLKAALAEREALTKAVGEAESEAARKTREHVSAVDALKKSIQELNAQALGRLDAKSAMEKAIDDAAAKAKEIKGKISIKGGIINLDNEAGREAHEILSAIAKTTAEYATKLEEAKAPQNEINEAWKRGREQLIGMSGSLGVSKADLTAYADTVLQTPESVVTRLKVEKKQADSAVDAAIRKIKSVPDEEKSRVTLEAQRAMERASQVESQLNALDGKTAHTYITNTIRTINEIITNSKTFRSVHDIVGATGGLASNLKSKRMFAGGGSVAGGVLQGPGSKTSDSLLARLSRGEFVMQAKAVDKYGPAFMEAVNAGRLEIPGFAKGGMTKAQKRAKAQRDAENAARKDAAGELTISHFGKIAGYKNPEIRNQLGAPDALGDLVSSLNKWRSVIKKTTHGVTESRLLKHLNAAGTYLIRYEKNLAKVNKSLEKAKTKLDDLKSSASQMKESVKSGILGGANITRGASAEDSRVTINTLLSNMTGSAANAKQFASMLSDLKKRGLDKGLIEEIASAGVEGGGLETAAAIMGGGKSEIDRLNKLRYEIVKAGNSAGKTASDAMYGAGIKAAEGLVKGLDSQRKHIEKQMLSIALHMERAIKRALGIKSPSKVMQDIGHNTAEGFAIGVQKNKRAESSWASMLPRSHDGARKYSAMPVGSGGGSGAPMIVQLQIGGRNIGEVLIDPIRKSISHRGGNVQAVLGN